METTDDVEHLSIGEVLAQLQSEFPDVTISKIRFLESQGLIDPERTPSGYRKFYGPDIARLRWILRQQRDNFLPLKVIKSKLEQGDLDGDGGFAIQGHLWSEAEPSATTDDQAAAERAAAEAAWPSVAPGRSTAPAASGASTSTPAPAAATAAPSKGAASDRPASTPASSAASTAPSEPAGASGGDESNGSGSSLEWLSKLQESPRRPAPQRPADPTPAATTSAGRGLRFGRAEVLEVTGLDDATLDELVQYKLVVPTVIGGEATFDAASVGVVRSVLPFLRRGVEARHLGMFRNAAEREAGFYEQMILPLLKQRNPKAREEATKTLDELMAAGDELGRALVHQALRNHLGE